MMTLEFSEKSLIGITKEELQKNFSQYDLIRQIERYGIRKFMEENKPHLTGKVLDFGAGTSPYRDCISGEYIPFEKGENFPGNKAPFDAIICNQVMQFIENGASLVKDFHDNLKSGGHLIMTGGTNWPEVEADDIVRWTRNGMKMLLGRAGFDVLLCESRSQITMLRHICFSLGWNLIAKKP